MSIIYTFAENLNISMSFYFFLNFAEIFISISFLGKKFEQEIIFSCFDVLGPIKTSPRRWSLAYEQCAIECLLFCLKNLF